MQAREKLKRFKAEFDQLLMGKIGQWRKEARELDGRYEVFIKVLEKFVGRGGKRVRPAFLYYAYLASGGEDREKAMRVGVALELLHAFLLMHDDLIDNSDLRRGGATVHKMFEEEYEKLGLEGGREEFGRSVAMILGDVVQMLTRRQLRELDLESEVYQEGEKVMEELVWETAYGWYVEMLNTKGEEISEEKVKRSMEYVSARYTVVGSVKMGAMLAGAEKKKIDSLEKYGVKLGLAFQVQDDILGMFGNREKVGKPVESDMKEGKKTLLILRTLKKLGEGEEKEKLEKVYGSWKAGKEDLEWVRKVIKEQGVLEEVKEEARELAEQAKQELRKEKWKEEGEEFLTGIASYIVEREV